MTPAQGSRHPAERPGLQGQRTELSWERSALGLIAAAALLLFRHVGPSLARVVLAVVLVGLALTTIVLGRRRGRRIRALRTDAEGRATVADAGPEVLIVGTVTAVVAVVTAFLLVLQA